MPKNILAVGYETPSDHIIEVELTSKQSLLDADIILFEPDISFGRYDDGEYLGKPCLSDSNSHIWKEAIGHWRREIADAVSAGKLVIVMLKAPVDVFVATGDFTYSGTGRNRAKTRRVSGLSSMASIPIDATFRASSGKEMLLDAHARFFAPFWEKFGSYASYEAVIQDCKLPSLLRTKSGNRLVGCYTRKGKGALILLPKIDFDQPSFTQEVSEGKRTVRVWTEEAIRLGHEMASAIVALAEALQSESPSTPTPDWATSDEYRLESERCLSKKIEAKTQEIALLEREKIKLAAELDQSGAIRDLLFEQGDRLEQAIIRALEVFGFEAEKVNDQGLEFDVVFQCIEGRCIGEAEGRDNREINITKFSQLERKIAEDFARDEVTEHAKGVLFGNPHRLLRPDQRPGDFTSKCIAAAARTKSALVRTADMFLPVKYLTEHDDPKFAQQCRFAILGTEGGIVKFPSVPCPDIPASNADIRPTRL